MLYQLSRQEKDSFEAELALASAEEPFKRWAKEINDHSIIVKLRSKPTNNGNTNTPTKSFVNMELITEFRFSRSRELDLDSNRLSWNDIIALVDIPYGQIFAQWMCCDKVNWNLWTEWSRTNFVSEPVFAPHPNGGAFVQGWDTHDSDWRSSLHKQDVLGTVVWSVYVVGCQALMGSQVNQCYVIKKILIRKKLYMHNKV